MIAYITVGADDMERAEQFYSAFLPALGYRLEHYHGDLSYIPTATTGTFNPVAGFLCEITI